MDTSFLIQLSGLLETQQTKSFMVQGPGTKVACIAEWKLQALQVLLRVFLAGGWVTMSRTTYCNRSLVLSIVLMAVSGCIVTAKGEGERRHHVVIGFGIVSTNEAPSQAIVATDVSAVGITLSDRPGLKFGIGYTASTVVTVAPGAVDVRVEIFKPFNGPFIVNVPSAVAQEQKEDPHVP